MAVKVTVLYPNKDLKFNMDYYLSTHMPLVSKHWHKLGLTGWEVIDVKSGMPGSEPDFKVIAELHFKSEEDFEKAVKDESAKEIFGDVPNFSNVGPTLLMGNSQKIHHH